MSEATGPDAYASVLLAMMLETKVAAMLKIGKAADGWQRKDWRKRDGGKKLRQRKGRRAAERDGTGPCRTGRSQCRSWHTKLFEVGARKLRWSASNGFASFVSARSKAGSDDSKVEMVSPPS